jgi:hypothetical protein
MSRHATNSQQLDSLLTTQQERIRRFDQTAMSFCSNNETIKEELRSFTSSELSRQFGVEKRLTSESIDKYTSMIKNTTHQLLRYKNDIRLYETHMKNGTTPSELFYCRLPHPILPENRKFVENYNNI